MHLDPLAGLLSQLHTDPSHPYPLIALRRQEHLEPSISGYAGVGALVTHSWMCAKDAAMPSRARWIDCLHIHS